MSEHRHVSASRTAIEPSRSRPGMQISLKAIALILGPLRDGPDIVLRYTVRSIFAPIETALANFGVLL
jgi:hypothetical protein